MTKKPIQFLLGAFISLIIFLLFGVLNFFDVISGNCYTDPEAVDGRQFYLGLILTMFIICSIYKLVAAGYKYFSIGLSFALIFLVFGTCKIGLEYFNKTNYYKEFDSQLWSKSDDETKLKMARFLNKDNKFIGLHKKLVIEELGEPYYLSNDEITYNLGGGIFYRISFKIKNEKIIGSTITYKD